MMEEVISLRKICCVKNHFHGIAFFQGVFEMFLQNLWNVTTEDCFFSGIKTPQSWRIKWPWKCLMVWPFKMPAPKTGGSSGTFSGGIAWLYLGFIAVYQMIWESRKAKTHCQFKFVHSGFRKLPKETTWQKSILIIYVLLIWMIIYNVYIYIHVHA